MTASTILLPFQPTSMSTAQLAAVSFLARYSGRTHEMYTSQLARWFAWCEGNGLDPPVGIKRAHVELYLCHLGGSGLMDSSIVTMMDGVRGYFRFAHIDGPIAADPAVYARLPKVQQDESRTPGPGPPGADRRSCRSPSRSPSTTAPRPSCSASTPRAPPEAAGVRIEDDADTMRGGRVLHLVGKGNKPATMPLTVPVMRVLEACRGQGTNGTAGPPTLVREPDRPPRRVPDGLPNRRSRRDPAAHQPPLPAPRRDHQRPRCWVPLRDAQILARHADPRTTEHYDRARGNLDRHGVHFLTAYVAGV
jgi:hypothetical protein